MTTLFDKKLRQLNTLIEIASLINSSLDPVAIREKSIAASMKLLGTEAGSLMLVDPDKKDLFFDIAAGKKGKKVKSIRLKKGMGIAGWVAARGRPVIVHDAPSDPRFYQGADEQSGFRTKNMICIPVKSKNKIVGVLQAINKKKGEFEHDDMLILYALANQVAVAIENSCLHQQAITDGLTGLYHHKQCKLMLRDEIENAKKYAYPLSLILLDIDFFKQVNDLNGHLAGDMVLEVLAGVLKENIRKDRTRLIDITARYGGEEFAVILPSASYRNSFKVGERLRKAVEKMDFRGLRITISIGIGFYSGRNTDCNPIKLIETADTALYKAKRNGRNRTEIMLCT